MALKKYEEWLVEDNLLRLSAWARDGLTDAQIANNIGIAPKTLWEWKKEYSSISKALKKGKEVVDIEVENALYKNAVGYEYEEDVMTKEGIVRMKKYSKPDTVSQIYWLKNRKPKNWRDKPIDENESSEILKELAKAISELRQ